MTTPTETVTSLWPASYLSPLLGPNHCHDVLHGSYDIPYDPPHPPVILDLGANVGAFARWAVKRWPGCTLHCYEPFPANFKLLQQTVTEIMGEDEACVTLYDEGVLGCEGRGSMLAGEGNCGESKLVSKFTPGGSRVFLIDARDLPLADILKIDTEGAEWSILARLSSVGRLEEFKAVMLEYHDGGIVPVILELMKFYGFTPYVHRLIAEHRGELKFLRL